MSIVDAYNNKKKKEEEEQKIVGQQPKTQPTSNKPTGTTSIPKNNQGVSGRTQEKSTASSLRTENNVTTAKQAPKKEESKQNIVRRNTTAANTQENKQQESRSKATDQRQYSGVNRRNAQSSHGGSSGTFGTDDSKVTRYGLDPRKGQMYSYQTDKNTGSLLDDVNSLPMAPGTGMNQLNNLNDYTNKKADFDFKGKETIGSRQTAKEDLENTLHGRDWKREEAKKDSSTGMSFLSGAGSTALGLAGDLGNLSEMLMPKKSTEGMTPNEIYERAMSNAPTSILNYSGKEMKGDYDAYKNYVLDRMESGDVTPEEMQNMRNLEDAFSKTPAHYLNELGGDARAMNEGFAEGHEISNLAGSLAPLMLENVALGPMADAAGGAASTIANPGVRMAALQGANLIPDVLTDTIPEVMRNVNDEVSADKIISDAAKNLALNEAANLGFEYAPKIIKGIGSKLNGSNVAKRATEEAIPEVAEQAVKNIPDLTGNPYLDVPEINVASNVNKARGNADLGMLRDSIYDNLAKNGGNDEALANLMRAGDVESLSYFDKALKDYDALTGGTQSKQLSRLNDIVNGRIPDGLDAKGYGDILNNIDNIESGLNRIGNLEGLSDLGRTHLNSAYDALNAYEDAVRNGGDADTAAKELNRVLGNLDNQAKKAEGYDGIFSQWKGGGTARGDLFANTNQIKKNIPESLANISPKEAAEVNDLYDFMPDENRFAKPANQTADTMGANTDISGINILKNNIPEATTKAPETNSKIPELEGTPKYDRGPKERIIDTNDIKERGYARSTRNNADVPDELAAEFVNEPEVYNVLHNKDTRANADAVLNQGFDKAYADFKDLLTKKDPAAIPVGYDLAKQMIDNGDTDGAAELIRDMSRELTKTGQFSQAAAMTIMRGDPMTALRYAQKEIDALNTQGAKKYGKKWKELSLTDDEIKQFNNIEIGDKEAISNLYDSIGTRLGKEYTTNGWDKLREARRVAMLFNMRTQTRNLGANVPTLAMRWTSDRIDALGQHAAHLIDPDFKVNQSIKGSTGKRSLAKDIFENDPRVQALKKGSTAKYKDTSIKNSLMDEKQVFKGTAAEKWINRATGGGIEKINKILFGKEGVESIPETIRNATYKLLDMGDSPFVKENFVDRLGSYMNAQNISRIEDVPDDAIQIAWDAALKATYKDESQVFKSISGLKKSIEQLPIVGKPAAESAISFVQAPANIGQRILDYSPVGGAKGVKNIFKGVQEGNEQAVREGIKEVSDSLTGIGLVYFGMKLKQAGLITGTYSQDADEKAQQQKEGFKEFALHIGDHYYTYDWAQPFAQNLIFGTLIQDAIDKEDQSESQLMAYLGGKLNIPELSSGKASKVVGAVERGAKASINSWFNATPMQNMADLFSTSYYDEDGIAGNLKNALVDNFITGLVPSQMKAVTKIKDPYKHQLKDPSNSWATLENKLMSGIPGLSENVPVKYDTWGKPMKYGEMAGERAFASMLNPGEYSYEKKEPIDDEIDRLYKETGNNSVFSHVAPNKLSDGPLTARQVSDLQKEMGERSYEGANTLMNDSDYQYLPDEYKAEAFKDVYSATDEIAKLSITDPETYQKIVNGDEEAISTLDGLTRTYAESGTQGLIDEIIYKKTLKEIGLKDSDQIKEIYDNGGSREEIMKQLQDYKDFQDWYKAEGFGGTGKLPDRVREIYDSDATQEEKNTQLHNYRVYKDLSEEVGLNASASNEQLYHELGEDGFREYADIYKKAQELSGAKKDGSAQITNKGIIKALDGMSDEEIGKWADIFIDPNQAAQEANKQYANGTYKYYKYKAEADANGDGKVSQEETHAYFDPLNIPGSEKAYFDKALRNAKTSTYDGTAKKSTSTNKNKKNTKIPEVEATGDNNFDTFMKAKQKAREDAKQGDTNETDWMLSNGFNLKNTQTYQRAVDAKVSDSDFLAAWRAADADGNGYMKKAEAQAYVNALPKEERTKWFNILYKSNRKGKKKKK